MNINTILIAVGAMAVIWYIVTTIRIYEALRSEGVKVNFLFLKFLAPKYAEQYKNITRNATGKTGPLFYHWILSINIAALVVIILAIINFI